MSLKYEKWRDLIIDPFSIKFKTIKIKKSLIIYQLVMMWLNVLVKEMKFQLDFL